MILVQSVIFVLPSIIFGYAVSLPSLKYIYAYLFSNSPSIHLSILPSAYATFLAVILGLIIPLFASLVPIKVALSKNLNQVLNTSRSKSNGVIVTTENESS